MSKEPQVVVKKSRGRPPGSPNKNKKSFPDPSADNPNIEPGDNNPPEAEASGKPKAPAKVKPKNPQPQVSKEPLTDEQEHALTAHHAAAYEKALAAKKSADATFKNTCKLAKAEGVPVKQIKEYLEYQTEEGQEELRAEIARKHKVARWAGLPVGTQLAFFDEIDRTPIDERIADEGKRAGMKGEPCAPPRHLPGDLAQLWTMKWHEGQEIMATKGFKQKEDPASEPAAADDADLRPPFLRADSETVNDDLPA